MVQLLSVLFGLASVSPSLPAVIPFVPVTAWVAEADDRFIADTQANRGYIVHTDGSFTAFPIGSGKQEKVHYAGMTYDASTPSESWEVKSTTLQTDHATFGKTGLFLRLYAQGEDQTHYGIHATGNIDDILAGTDRYKSMGCILVSDQVLDLLDQTYELHHHSLQVITVNGLPQATTGSSPKMIASSH